jgi:hypothetical protein
MKAAPLCMLCLSAFASPIIAQTQPSPTVPDECSAYAKALQSSLNAHCFPDTPETAMCESSRAWAVSAWQKTLSQCLAKHGAKNPCTQKASIQQNFQDLQNKIGRDKSAMSRLRFTDISK